MLLSIIILAAGQGKRMHSKLPKVLHRLAGKPLLEHVIKAATDLNSNTPPIVIYGHQGDKVMKDLSHHKIHWVEQKEQLGTGHAIMQALPSIPENHQVMILSGDVPLISVQTLQALIAATPPTGLGMITANFPHPTGLGRIIRDQHHKIIRIVEEKDATAIEHEIHEINSGIYLTTTKHLQSWLPTLKNTNAQSEYYLTDIIPLAIKENITIHSIQPAHFEEVYGVNDRAQLAFLERFHQHQLALHFMRKGLTLLDPHRFDIRGELTVGEDVTIDLNVIIEGNVTLGNNCRIGANCILRDCIIGDNVEIKANTIIEDADIASDCVIGPFARIRPGTALSSQVHIGNFVEIKNSAIAKGTKINHLSYIGDATIGELVNIGAGTITCNYDGFNKHRTQIGDRVQVGSDSTLVAPISIHDDVYIATATTVRNDVPAGSLVFNRRTEELRAGWTANKRSQLNKSAKEK